MLIGPSGGAIKLKFKTAHEDIFMPFMTQSWGGGRSVAGKWWRQDRNRRGNPWQAAPGLVN
jgi:hypothetical protein